MPLLILLVLVLLTPLLVIALMPLGILQRYRAGTARRVARGWLASVNIAALLLSLVLFLVGTAVTNIFVPKALSYALGGLAGGCVLGVLGLALTRWETGAPGRVHYTPNRLLVLGITLVVILRLGYGFWRLWSSWRGGGNDGAWLTESGVPGSLAAGAVVLGYSLAYWIGVRRKGREHRAATASP